MSAARWSRFLGSEVPEQVTVVRKLSPGLVTFSMPHTWPAKLGDIRMGARCTAISMKSGGITIVSPIPYSECVRKEIESLEGMVHYVVLHNTLHHAYAEDWSRAFPAAQFIGPEEIIQSRRDQGLPELNMPFSYGSTKVDLPSDFADEFEVEQVGGHQLKEIVLFHRPSRTLLQADLLFLWPLKEQYSKSTLDPSGGGISNRLNNLAMTRLRPDWVTTNFLKGKDDISWRSSLRRISEWDIERIIPCHGEIVETDGRNVFRSYFAKTLG